MTSSLREGEADEATPFTITLFYKKQTYDTSQKNLPPALLFMVGI